MTPAQAKQRAHELIDRMAPGQVAPVVGLLEILLDPVARSLANVPYDDEPVSEEERREIAASSGPREYDGGASHKELLAEYGLTAEEFEGREFEGREFEGREQTPLEPVAHDSGQ